MTREGPLWFAGSGKFAARCLTALADELTFSRVVTALPKPAGRGLAERGTPVDGTAEELGIPVFRTGDINHDETILGPSWRRSPFAFVVDFSQIIGDALVPEPGCLNAHPPAHFYRGAARIRER